MRVPLHPHIKAAYSQFYYSTGVDAMATTVPEAGTSTPVSTAAKRPAKT